MLPDRYTPWWAFLLPFIFGGIPYFLGRTFGGNVGLWGFMGVFLLFIGGAFFFAQREEKKQKLEAS